MISHGYCNDSCLNEDDPGTNPLPFNDTNADTKCDLVQFSFDDLDDPINDQNFTKQSANLNGRPFYYSMNQSILWWSNVEESWLYSAYVEETAYFQPMIKIKENLRSLSFSNETKWKNISQEQENGIIKSKCSTFSSQCLARRDGKYRFQFDNTTHLLSSFELTATSPCTFPFKFKGKVYTSCTEDHYELYWCATTVNATMHYQERHWGYCDESCLPGDITWYIIILIIVGTLTLFALVTLLILYSLGKLRCRCYGNNTTDHFIFTFRNFQ